MKNKYSLQQLINEYEALKAIVEESPQLSSQDDGFSKVQAIFEDKIANPDLKIMVYGVYNAGKSTLINAMAGEDVAEVGDIPVTATIAEYTCGSYKIIDTPGIDAPVEHEKITMQEMLKADAIIFVVNPIGVVEEQKTLNAMLELMANNKKVFLVFNEKHPLSHEDYLVLKDQTHKKIQELAPSFGLNNILNEIPISRLNAKAALAARKSGSEGFLNSTGYIDFELKLNDFLASITSFDINERLAQSLLSYLNEVINNLESNTDNNIVKNYDELIRDITNNRVNLRGRTRSNVESKEKELYQKIKKWLYNQKSDTKSDIKSYIQQELEQSCEILATEFRDDIDIQGTAIKADIDDLQAKIPDLKVKPFFDESVIDNSLNKEESPEPVLEQSTKGINIEIDKMGELSKSLQDNVKVEHIVMGLTAIKTAMPGLMKNISEKAIEKIAANTVAKYIPYIGVALTVVMTARDIFSTDPETKRLMQQQEAERRAYERWEQQIEDISSEISEKFARDILLSFYNIIDNFYNSIIEKLNALQDEFSEIDRNNSILLESLYGVQQNIISKAS
ncbi:GTPase [uncultured Psychrobacter sp.]|uniref:GTPase n=1 Tax=uncultured Psychrobacter sp. TaxID=259303 RepID=UPI002593390B|nr:GTPase [uncultured Psychrobacter sp.]